MKKILFILPLLVGILIINCSDDDNNPVLQPDDTETSTWIEDGSYWESFIDATSEDEYVYFSFAIYDTVTVTDPANDANWDIAFKRYHVILNGGLSGNKGVVGVDLATVGSPDSIDFAAVVDTSDITSDDWMEDSYDLAVDEWYNYDYNTHELTPTNYVYILKDATEKYVKFQVIDMFDGSMPPDMGSVTFRYVYAASGSDLSGAPDTLTLEVGSGTGYVDFSTGTEVTPADPENSTDWDIAFTDYEIHLNSTIWGPGSASAYPAYDDEDLLDDPTDFDSLSSAVTSPYGYMTDTEASAFTDWYDYNNETHQMPSRDHVYLIKVDDVVYKMQIHSYYYEGSLGYYTFFWAEL